jgi:MAC/Perforin domain
MALDVLIERFLMRQWHSRDKIRLNVVRATRDRKDDQINTCRFWGLFRRKVETAAVSLYRRLYHDYYSLQMRLKQIAWYTLAVSMFPYPKFNTVTQQALARLPATFKASEIQIWKRFFDAYGTHVVVAANMGGLLTSETWYEKCLAYEHSEEWINQQVAFTFLSFTYGFGQHTKQIDAKFLEHSQIKSELLGGSTSIDPADWRNWARCYRRDLAAPHSNQPSNTY